MTWRRYPHWGFQCKSPTKLPTDNMVARDEAVKEKIENLKRCNNLLQSKNRLHFPLLWYKIA